MPKVTQLQILKNIALTNKLAEYIELNPDMLKTFPKDVPFIIFSTSDITLNKLNMQILKSLQNKGEPVVKAEEMPDQNTPWKFTLA